MIRHFFEWWCTPSLLFLFFASLALLFWRRAGMNPPPVSQPSPPPAPGRSLESSSTLAVSAMATETAKEERPPRQTKVDYTALQLVHAHTKTCDNYSPKQKDQG